MAIAGGGYPSLRATGKCAATGRDLQFGEHFVATLTEQPGTPGLGRVDFSVEAWAGGARPAAPAQVVGMWRATYQPEAQKKSPLLGDQEMLDLFEELGPSHEERQERFRFLLALLLIRRRLLRVISTRRTPKGSILSVLRRGEDAGQRTPMEVVDPGLDEATITEAIEQLGLLVDSGTAPGTGGVEPAGVQKAASGS